jgi:hypothetical protein
MGVRIISVDDYERHQKRILFILITLLIVGLVYLIYDDYQNANVTVLPESVLQLDPMLAQWKAENFIRSFDVALSKVVVDEEKWQTMKRSEKLDFVTQLARYCARKNKSRQWSIQVYGLQSKNMLAEMGKSGFRVE